MLYYYSDWMISYGNILLSAWLKIHVCTNVRQHIFLSQINKIFWIKDFKKVLKKNTENQFWSHRNGAIGKTMNLQYFSISRDNTWGIFTNILEYSNIRDILPQEFLNVGVMTMYNVAKICRICAKLSRLDKKKNFEMMCYS